MWTRVTAGLVVVVMGATVLGCTSTPSPEPTSSGALTPPTTAAGPTSTSFAGDLLTVLVAKPPSTTQVLSPATSTRSGNFDAQAVATVISPTQAQATGARLTELGFRQAASVSWMVGQLDRITITLIQFASEDDARQWTVERRPASTSKLWDEAKFARSDLPKAFDNSSHGNWYVFDFDDVEGFGGAWACFYRGDIAGYLTVSVASEASIPGMGAIADDQYARLP